MTTPGTTLRPEPTSTSTPTSTWPMAFWLFVQIAALALAAAQWPLVLGQEQPTERLALPLVVSVQFAAAALAAGPLLGGPWRGLIAIALTWPMLQLAGLLGWEPQSHILAASGAVALWLAAMACWIAALPRAAAPVVGALASAWALGGVALAWLHADFGSAPGTSVFPTDAWISPLLGAVNLVSHPSDWGTWAVLGANLAIAAAALAVARRLTCDKGQSPQTQVPTTGPRP